MPRSTETRLGCKKTQRAPVRATPLPLAAALGLVLVISPSLFAELPLARLASVFPPGAAVGGSADVELAGQNLDDGRALLFSHPGITAQSKDATHFVVSVSSNVPPGVYEMRVAGRFGLSNPRAFEVAAWTEINEKGPNASAEQAQEIQLGQVVNGRTDANAIDHYKFTATKGRRVLIECRAERLDSKVDPVLVVSQEKGNELASSRRGSLLDFTPPADGVYVVKVHDVLYRGGSDFIYRLVAHSGPHLDFVIPPCGQPGNKSKFTLYGRNLPGSRPVEGMKIDGASLEALEVEIALPEAASFRSAHADGPDADPADAAIPWIEWSLDTPHGRSNPVRIGAATAPVLVEVEPNNNASQAQSLTLPVEYVGQFYPARDRDWVTFQAGKDEAYWIEMISDRLGLPTSPSLLIQRVATDDKGKQEVADVKELFESEANVGGREFNTASRDSNWLLEVKEAGTYRILVRDLFQYAEPKPDHLYRLAIRKAAPDFQLATVVEQPLPEKNDARDVGPWPLYLRQGESWALKVLALRRDGFKGPIDLRIEGLPAGVQYAGGKISEGQSSTIVYLTAAKDASAWMGPIRVMGTARIGEEPREREACGSSVLWEVGDYNNETVRSRTTAATFLAVGATEPAAIILSPESSDAPKAAAGTTLEIPLQIARNYEFTETLKFKAVGLDALDKMKEFEVDGKATNATLKIDLKEYKVPAGSYRVALRTLTKGKYRDQPEAAKQAEQASKAAEKEAAEAAEAVKKAEKELETASNESNQAQTQAKALQDKFEAAKIALEKSPQDETALKAKADAEQAAQSAENAAKQSAQTKAAAEKNKAQTEERAKLAEAKKKETAEQAKAAVERAKPKDAIITVYSAPLAFEVTPAPEKAKEAEKK